MHRIRMVVGCGIVSLGGALVGAILGGSVGDVHLELTAGQLVTLGGATGGLATLIACGFATERQSRRDRKRSLVHVTEQRCARIIPSDARPVG